MKSPKVTLAVLMSLATVAFVLAGSEWWVSLSAAAAAATLWLQAR